MAAERGRTAETDVDAHLENRSPGLKSGAGASKPNPGQVCVRGHFEYLGKDPMKMIAGKTRYPRDGLQRKRAIGVTMHELSSDFYAPQEFRASPRFHGRDSLQPRLNLAVQTQECVR